jgi:magnesium chelatase family protein
MMDEFLEFHPAVQEALREPMEEGRITIARGQEVVDYPAEFLLIATTNLCPCGRYVPERENLCHCDGSKQRRYFSRLSGPVLDRFAILQFSNLWQKEARVISAEEIRDRVFEAREFALKSRGQKIPNSRLSVVEAEGFIPPSERVYGDEDSYRRKAALWKVARTLADLHQFPKITARELQVAREMAILPFLKIRTQV